MGRNAMHCFDRQASETPKAAQEDTSSGAQAGPYGELG